MKARKVSLLLACTFTCVLSASSIALVSQSQQWIERAVVPADARVDINTASLEQLMKVPGLPRTWAVRIIRYRPYRAKNELLERGVVPSQVYDRIKDSIIAHRVKP